MVAKTRQSGRVVVGTSGYVYDHWDGLFYPPEVAKVRWFEYYASQFDTVELNATFYRLFPETTFTKWHNEAPAGFIYAVKLWRWITHRKRLKGITSDLETFLERAVLLKQHLGPVLIQLPPSMKRDDERLEAFLALCGETQNKLKEDFRFAVEFRHASWFESGVYELLRRHRTALVLPDMPALHGTRECTADFIYVRFHGRPGLYGSLYSHQMLTNWAQWLREHLKRGVDVYAYFNNDDHAHAPRNAQTLRKYLTRH
jgi:uncharacterized protein YecE (DUF72 family)